MEMAGKISSPEMYNIAIGFLELDLAVVTSVTDSCGTNKRKMNYQLLQIWRNKGVENTREVEICASLKKN